MLLNILYFIVLINEILALITVFREERDIAATWAWLLVLSFLPMLGFLIYAFVGRKLPKKRLFRFQYKDNKLMYNILKEQGRIHNNPEKIRADEVSYSYRTLVKLFKTSDVTDLSRRNHVKVFTEGNHLFDCIISDIQNAKSSINIEFYTFYDDKIGHRVLNELVKKAKQGVKIHVIYDSWGSMGNKHHFFDPLREAGGFVEPFLHTHSAVMDFRLNFRDHRKIVVIDGKYGYIGGFNIGDQYLGRKKKFGNWRDTHLRISGSAVHHLQAQFILDWNVTDMEHKIDVKETKGFYFPKVYQEGSTNIQIVSSGPNSDLQQIKLGYIKMIQNAKNYCWIQSPYLIPDDSALDAIRTAAMSGVDIRIMVPCMPDHPFVYRATQYYAKQLSKYGVKIYFYQDGFIHAKTVLVDGKIASVGSANMDFRSFKLNFEINAFIYDEGLAEQLHSIYVNDIRNSKLMTFGDFEKQSRWLKFKQVFSRLFSPIL